MKTELMLEMPEPLRDLIKDCESYCVAYGCGLDAFDTSKECVGIETRPLSNSRAEKHCFQRGAVYFGVRA